MMEYSLSISDKCIGCSLCVKVCIRGHLALNKKGKAEEIDSELSCFKCGHCMAVCPTNAVVISGLRDNVPVLIEKIPVSPDDLYSLFRQRRSQRWFDRKCTKDELSELLSSVQYAPTAENSHKVEFVVVDETFDDFMKMCASIIEPHTMDHPRLGQFVDYVKGGMEQRNNPFTWEGRQLIVAFSAIPIDAIIAMEQLELMAYSMGLGGFHSRWLLQASESDPLRFKSFFPMVPDELSAFAVFIIGHPRVKYRRTVPRDETKVHWM